MKRLYLTSTVNFVAERLAKDLNPKAPNNQLAFILTATEDKHRTDKSWIENDRNSLKKAGFEVFDYTIAGKTKDQIRKDLNDVGYLYVEGGNTYYLLEKAQQSGFVDLVKDFVLREEKVYIGTSAGSIVASRDTYPAIKLDDLSVAPNLKGYEGFGLVDFTVLPHWGSDTFKNGYLPDGIAHTYKGNSELILLRDNQYIEVKDDWYRIVEV